MIRVETEYSKRKFGKWSEDKNWINNHWNLLSGFRGRRKKMPKKRKRMMQFVKSAMSAFMSHNFTLLKIVSIFFIKIVSLKLLRPKSAKINFP